MCPARLIDATDTEIRLDAAYSAPSLRPISLTWCRVCARPRCSHPGHVTLTFDASHQDAAGVWVFQSANRWPETSTGRRVEFHDEHGNPIRIDTLPDGPIPDTLSHLGESIPLWSTNSGGAIVYRRIAVDG